MTQFHFLALFALLVIRAPSIWLMGNFRHSALGERRNPSREKKHLFSVNTLGLLPWCWINFLNRQNDRALDFMAGKMTWMLCTKALASRGHSCWSISHCTFFAATARRKFPPFTSRFFRDHVCTAPFWLCLKRLFWRLGTVSWQHWRLHSQSGSLSFSFVFSFLCGFYASLFLPERKIQTKVAICFVFKFLGCFTLFSIVLEFDKIKTSNAFLQVKLKLLFILRCEMSVVCCVSLSLVSFRNVVGTVCGHGVQRVALGRGVPDIRTGQRRVHQLQGAAAPH